MIHGYQTLRVDFRPPKFGEVHLANSLILTVEGDHARDNHTHQSCHNIIALINNVRNDWKTEKNKNIALHSTNRETRGAFPDTNEGLYLQDMMEFLGFNENHTRLLPIYKDSQPCISILQAKTLIS